MNSTLYTVPANGDVELANMQLLVLRRQKYDEKRKKKTVCIIVSKRQMRTGRETPMRCRHSQPVDV